MHVRDSVIGASFHFLPQNHCGLGVRGKQLLLNDCLGTAAGVSLLKCLRREKFSLTVLGSMAGPEN